MRKEDDGWKKQNLELGIGYAILDPSFSFYIFSPYLQPLYWNPIKFFHLVKSRLSDHKV
jgi:hypothetical protein